MPAAVWDPTQLLVVLVDEGARVTDLIATDGQPGRPIDVRQARRPAAAKHGADGRGGMTQQRAKAVRSPAPGLPGGEDPLDLVGRCGPRRAVRPGAPVSEAGGTFESIPPDPLVARRAADALGFCRCRHGPAGDDHAIDQQLPTELVETRRTMCHESLPAVRSFNTPYRARRLSLVNNVPEDNT